MVCSYLLEITKNKSMKQFIVSLIAIIFSVQLTYADTYQIFSFEKTVYVKKGNSNWLQAKKKLQLYSTDSIKIDSNSSIKIQNISSGQTYEWKEQGKYEVGDIVRECLSRKANWLQRLFSTLFENITDEPNKQWVSQGSTKKGNNNDVLEHALAKKLISYCYGLNEANSDLVLYPKNVGKNELYFDITNNTHDTLYVNVMAVNIKQESFTILYDIRDKDNWMTLPILPMSSMSLSDFTISDKKKYKYVLFGTTKPVEILKLEKYLNVDVIDDILPKVEDVIIIGNEQKMK